MGAKHTGTTQSDTETNDTDRNEGKSGYVRLTKYELHTN